MSGSSKAAFKGSLGVKLTTLLLLPKNEPGAFLDERGQHTDMNELNRLAIPHHVRSRKAHDAHQRQRLRRQQPTRCAPYRHSPNKRAQRARICTQAARKGGSVGWRKLGWHPPQ